MTAAMPSAQTVEYGGLNFSGRRRAAV